MVFTYFIHHVHCSRREALAKFSPLLNFVNIIWFINVLSKYLQLCHIFEECLLIINLIRSAIRAHSWNSDVNVAVQFGIDVFSVNPMSSSLSLVSWRGDLVNARDNFSFSYVGRRLSKREADSS